MATKPLTSEAIALTEKKMDMSLDDIIKMSKTKASNSGKQRASIKNRRFSNGTKEKPLKLRQYMDSRSMLRQRVLVQRRSTFQGKSFSLASEGAQKASFVPFHNRANTSYRAANWNKPRPAGSMRRQGNPPNGGNAFKPQKQQQQQQHTGDAMPKKKPKTLDSLFANMKENRMRSFAHGNPVSTGRNAGVGNRQRQPWLRGRFGNYRN